MKNNVTSTNIAFTTARFEAHFLTAKNQQFLVDLYNRGEIAKYLQGLDVEKDIDLTLTCYHDHKNVGAYLIFCNEISQFIGFGGMHKQEPMQDGSRVLDDEFEFVIIIDDKHGGKGYAREFSAAFLDFFFEQFPEKSMPARVSKENIACIKLLEKLGFIHESETYYHDYNNRFHLMRIKK